MNEFEVPQPKWKLVYEGGNFRWVPNEKHISYRTEIHNRSTRTHTKTMRGRRFK